MGSKLGVCISVVQDINQTISDDGMMNLFMIKKTMAKSEYYMDTLLCVKKLSTVFELWM